MATYLDSSVLFVAFPDITNSFSNATTATLSWVLNAYTITFAALLVPAGKLGDRLGPRRALYIGSVIFTLASMVCGLAGSIELLIFHMKNSTLLMRNLHFQKSSCFLGEGLNFLAPQTLSQWFSY